MNIIVRQEKLWEKGHCIHWHETHPHMYTPRKPGHRGRILTHYSIDWCHSGLNNSPVDLLLCCFFSVRPDLHDIKWCVCVGKQPSLLRYCLLRFKVQPDEKFIRSAGFVCVFLVFVAYLCIDVHCLFSAAWHTVVLYMCAANVTWKMKLNMAVLIDSHQYKIFLFYIKLSFW